MAGTMNSLIELQLVIHIPRFGNSFFKPIDAFFSLKKTRNPANEEEGLKTNHNAAIL